MNIKKYRGFMVKDFLAQAWALLKPAPKYRNMLVPLALLGTLVPLASDDPPHHSYFAKFKSDSAPEAWQYLFISDPVHKDAAALDRKSVV